jgi:hypothetical protein
LHDVVAGFQASLVSAKIGCACRRYFWVESHLLVCPPVTLLAITLQLLDSLIPIGKYEEFCPERCLGIDLLSQAGGWLHLLIGSRATAPFVVDVVSIVIGHAVPIDEFAVRGDGYKVRPTTWDAPSPMFAAAIYATTRATLPVPTTSVMAVSVSMPYAMTGAVIAAARPMSDGKS